MKQRSFSNRIAFNFLAATAILILVIFCSIYLVVYQTVYNSLDEELETEYLEVKNSIVILNDEIIFTNRGEWEEKEHAQTEVNPTFIQVTDTSGYILKKTPNLLETSLSIFTKEKGNFSFNALLPTGRVRQLQTIMTDERNQKAGFISVAVPMEGSMMVLKNLLFSLASAFPFALFALYFTTRILAHKSIRPVRTLIESTGKIRHENLNDRVALPGIKDEMYTLTETINNLLDRVEDAVIREKQFSSDASHELRTPLAVLKGTLELMIRKPRDVNYFKEKTATCLEEVNRMSALADQLLILARYEKDNIPVKSVNTNISVLLDRVIARSANVPELNNMRVDLKMNPGLVIPSEPFMLEQILENIFSNALKYSKGSGIVRVYSNEPVQPFSITIRDEGIGMDTEVLAQIFNRFYRGDQSRSSAVKGYGLGLAIAKKLADLLGIRILVESSPGQGTAFTLVFPDAGKIKAKE